MAAQDHRSELATVRRRMEVVFLIFILAVGAIAARLVYLQWFRASGFAALAAGMSGRRIEIDARRGRIEDRNGNALAIDTLAKAITMNPRVVRDPAATAARLATLLGLGDREREAMERRLVRLKADNKAYIKLQRGVDRRLAERILAAVDQKQEPLLKSLALEDSPVRVNPSGSEGLQLIGGVNIDGAGIEALELKFDPVLRGHPGERQVRVDATQRPVPASGRLLEAPVDGRSIRLTIDRDIQHFAEQEVAKVAKEQSPDAVSVGVMDVATGQVLAMANYPTITAGDSRVTPAQRRNRTITDLFEPGSIFKVITACAALEYGVNTHTFCSGRRAIGNRSVGCSHGSHGATDLRRMVAMSCNLAAGTLSERVGPKNMYDFITRMGFQERTGIEFPGEEYARLQAPEKWKVMRTVNIGFGQGIAVTPLQILAAYAAIGNDGIYNPPTLVLDAGGMPLPKREPRRVMSAANAAAVRSHMEATVTSGTGRAAKIAGFSVGGKTGTAQIAKNGRYGHGYVTSFGGLIPAAKPRLAILVSVWRPRRGRYGGTVSAPVFREIARQCVDYLAIPPDTPNDDRDGARGWRAEGRND
jgi:cell division protein FtsI/penicillin-binding protein 2